MARGGQIGSVKVELADAWSKDLIERIGLFDKPLMLARPVSPVLDIDLVEVVSDPALLTVRHFVPFKRMTEVRSMSCRCACNI